jgi:predicted nucleic acid-binding protein
LLLEIFDGHVCLLMSTALLLEYEAVLTRPTVLRMIGIDTASVLAVLDELAGLCTPVALDYRWRPVAADPDDDMVIETGINGGADAIATFNLGDMRAGAERFGVVAQRPATILRRLRS